MGEFLITTLNEICVILLSSEEQPQRKKEFEELTPEEQIRRHSRIINRSIRPCSPPRSVAHRAVFCRSRSAASWPTSSVCRGVISDGDWCRLVSLCFRYVFTRFAFYSGTWVDSPGWSGKMNCGRAASDGVYRAFSRSLFSTMVFFGNSASVSTFFRTPLNAHTTKNRLSSFIVNPSNCVPTGLH
jgi:hypothetical protein